MPETIADVEREISSLDVKIAENEKWLNSINEQIEEEQRKEKPDTNFIDNLRNDSLGFKWVIDTARSQRSKAEGKLATLQKEEADKKKT